MDPLYQREELRDYSTAESDGEEVEQTETGTDPTLSTRIFTVLKFLQEIPEYAAVSFDRLLGDTGLDLDLHDDLKQALLRNPKVTIKDNTIAYKPKYRFNNLAKMIEVLESAQSIKGITSAEVLEACQDPFRAEELMNDAILSGLVITLKSGRSNTDKVFFPRGKRFFVELSGKFKVVSGREVIVCDEAEPVKEVNRGDAIFLGNEYLKFLKSDQYEKAMKLTRRVSLCSNPATLTSQGYNHSQNLVTNLYQNKSPFSCSSMDKSNLEAEHKQTTFIYKFTDKKLPVDPPLSTINSTEGEIDVKLFKYGCTNDVRDLWRKVSEKTCFKAEQKPSLIKEMLAEGLITEEQIKEQNRKTLFEVKSKRKRKRRKVSRPIKISNTHMV